MRFWIAALLFALWATPALPQEQIALSQNELLQWDFSHDGSVFSFGETEMRLELIYPSESQDWIEGAYLHVTRGGEEFQLHTEAGLSGFGELGIYQIDRQGGLSIVFGAYTGGAHCCMAVQSVLLSDSGHEIADLGLYDGEYVEPQDLDGDGLYEFDLWDGRFNYSFDSYASSFTPIVIYATDGGELVDITNEQAFYAQVKENMQQQANYCGGPDGWYASACAALAANAARLGQYETQRERIATYLETRRFHSGWDEYSFCEDEACDTTLDFANFVEALDYALKNWGYLPTD